MNKKEIIEKIKNGSLALDELSGENRDDFDIALTAVKVNGWELQYVSERLKNNKVLVLSAVNKFGYSLKHASDQLQDDFDFVMTAVRTSCGSLEYASNRLKNNDTIVNEAINKNVLCLYSTSDRIQNTYENLIKLKCRWESEDNSDLDLAIQTWYENKMEVLANIESKMGMVQDIQFNENKPKKLKF